MSILSVESIYCEDETVYVTAVVEDIVEIPATYYDPPEYGPALCEASFSLDEDEVLPEDEKQLIELLEKYDLEWTIVDCSDY
jgi:hypothetical protein